MSSGPEQMDIEDFLDLIHEGHIAAVEAVLDAGFDVNTSRDSGYTPLMMACEADSLEMVTLFLDRGANVNAQDDAAFTALIYASNAGHTDIVNELCLHGADVNMYDFHRRGALHYAAQNGNVEIVHKLFIRGANLDAKSNTATTPLMEAVGMGYHDIVQELILDGADVNIADNNGNTALMFGCKYKYAKIVDILCKNGANVNAKKNDDVSALIYVCKEGNEELADILLENGADPNLRSGDMTPLMAATFNGDDGIIKSLIAAGADVNASCKNSIPLLVASNLGHLHAVIALCEAGAKHKRAAAMIAKTDEIRNYLTTGIIPGGMWKGMTQSDIKKLDTIFTDDAINYSTCPVCLGYVSREDGCMYMYHNCSQGTYYHKKLYDKYKSDEGNIEWCTICGRITHEHRHYKLGAARGVKPEQEDPVQNLTIFFKTDCKSQGGGGPDEKLARFRRMREYALELEEKVDKMPNIYAMNRLVEEVWNAPLRDERNLVSKIRHEKKWNIPLNTFRNNSARVPNNANVNAPNIPFEGELPLQKRGFNNVSLEDDVELVIFNHRQKDGSKKEHGISKVALEDFIKTINTQFGTLEFGYCFSNQCDARLHPAEIKEHVPEAVYNEYRKKFNKKMATQAGGGGIFRELTDAVCVLPKRGGTRRNKKKGKGKTRRV